MSASRLRVGLDISRTVEESAGIGQYARQLMNALAEIDSVNAYVIYPFFHECLPDNWKHARIPSKPNFQMGFKYRSERSIRRCWNNPFFDRERFWNGVDLVHSTAYAAPLLKRKPLVVTIHDMTPFIYPQFHTPENCQLVMRNVLRASRRAARIIAVSESTKKDVMRLLHLPEKRIAVIHEGVGRIFHPRRDPRCWSRIKHRFLIREPFLLGVGSVEPRKNFQRVIAVFAALKRQRRIPHQLVIVGGSGWRNGGIHAFVEEEGLAGEVVFTGYLEEADVAELYRRCELFLYPSLYEGFGLPVLEAMSCGAPVVTSNVSSMPEVGGDAVVYVNPEDTFELYEAVTGLIENQFRLLQLSAAGSRRASRFSWTKTAKRTLEVYESVARDR